MKGDQNRKRILSYMVIYRHITSFIQYLEEEGILSQKVKYRSNKEGILSQKVKYRSYNVIHLPGISPGRPTALHKLSS